MAAREASKHGLKQVLHARLYTPNCTQYVFSSCVSSISSSLFRKTTPFLLLLLALLFVFLWGALSAIAILRVKLAVNVYVLRFKALPPQCPRRANNKKKIFRPSRAIFPTMLDDLSNTKYLQQCQSQSEPN